MPPPRGRLAPSPTGALHLGNARSFLLAWLSVRSRGGSVVLRMEDLDHPKVKPWAAEEACEDLRWLGLDWDEGPGRGGPSGPYVQSERLALYAAALERLRAAGSVYPCVCSRKDVEAGQSAPHEGEEGPRYPGHCLGRFESYEAAAAALPPGRLPAWRFRAPDRETVFTDLLYGEERARVAERDGDFVIARHPKGAGYQLAVVVDDAAMGITEVARGADLLASTHRQILLQEALGLERPAYLHLPLLTGPDGRRLAKRHGDTRLARVREAGTSPALLRGWLAHTCGWAERGEELGLPELLARYDPRRLPRAPYAVTREDCELLGIA